MSDKIHEEMKEMVGLIKKALDEQSDRITALERELAEAERALEWACRVDNDPSHINKTEMDYCMNMARAEYKETDNAK